MENKFINKWNFKTIILFVILAALPNLLAMVNIATPFGFKIHTFQTAIFVMAILYGPMGGLVSGIVGSVYSGLIMHNPYLIIGNAILGFFVGYFLSKKMNVIKAVSFAFLIQLPWLVLTDYYLMHMPLIVIGILVMSLAISNLVWSFISKKIVEYGNFNSIKG